MTQLATGSATSSRYEEAAVSLHDAARAGWGLSYPTSRMSLASGLPRGQGGAGGEGVTWPLACHIHPSPLSVTHRPLVSFQEGPRSLEPGLYPQLPKG